MSPSSVGSDRFRTAFPRPNADTIFQRQDENLAVADASLRSGSTGFHDGVDGRLNEILIDGNLQLDLAQQVERQLVAAVYLGVPLLPAEALHVHDGQAKHFDLVER